MPQLTKSAVMVEGVMRTVRHWHNQCQKHKDRQQTDYLNRFQRNNFRQLIIFAYVIQWHQARMDMSSVTNKARYYIEIITLHRVVELQARLRNQKH